MLLGQIIFVVQALAVMADNLVVGVPVGKDNGVGVLGQVSGAGAV